MAKELERDEQGRVIIDLRGQEDDWHKHMHSKKPPQATPPEAREPAPPTAGA